MRLECVVHEPRAVHRLDHRTHTATLQARCQAAQSVGVGRHRGLRDQLAAVVEQANIEPTST
jgi:hypothetical protein